jgi:hypothetical protein
MEKAAVHGRSDAEKKDIITSAWECRNGETIPYLVELGNVHVGTAPYFESDDNEIAWNEEYHNKLSVVADYNFPNIKPNLGIGTIAASFGCEYVPNNEADPWVRPIITIENLEDVEKIEKPDVLEAPIFKRAYERIAYLESRSSLPLRTVNIASPLVTASLLWEYTSFIESTVLETEKVHYILEIITEITIDYIHEQLKRINNLYTMGHEPWYIPPGVGVRISDDTAAVMSPATFEEFGVPYNSRISEEFGGLVWHSCGDVQAVMEKVLMIKGLKGIDIAMPQNNWEKIRDIVDDKVAKNLRFYWWDHEHESRPDQAEYARQLIDFFGRKGTLLLTSEQTVEESSRLSKNLMNICG